MEKFTYENRTDHSEGTFKAIFNGTSYNGHYECEIDTELEHSSENGPMGISEQKIEKESIHLVSGEPLGTEEEYYVCPEKFPDIYKWIHIHVNVCEEERWELKPIAGTTLMNGMSEESFSCSIYS